MSGQVSQVRACMEHQLCNSIDRLVLDVNQNLDKDMLYIYTDEEKITKLGL